VAAREDLLLRALEPREVLEGEVDPTARGVLAESPVRDFVAAVSVGIYHGTPVLDLDYAEDSACDTDMNVVMTGAGGFVELQGTAEGAPFTPVEMVSLVALAERGIRELIGKQRAALNLAK